MKITGMVAILNDDDIITECLDSLIQQGIFPVVLDNGSTDKSFEICKKYENDKLIKLTQFITDKYELGLILRILYDVALTTNPDWLVRCDADELIESGIAGKNIAEVIQDADKERYNLLQFDNFEFFMTDKDDNSKELFRDKMTYYSWQKDNVFRAWKFIPGTQVDITGGHYPIFPTGIKYKIFPEKMIIRHYRFRSKEQAQKKIKERTERIKNTSEKKMGWHRHWDKIWDYDCTKQVSSELLTKYHNDQKWDKEWKFHPFLDKMRPKKNELFTDEGLLKNRPKTYSELKNQIKKNR